MRKSKGVLVVPDVVEIAVRRAIQGAFGVGGHHPANQNVASPELNGGRVTIRAAFGAGSKGTRSYRRPGDCRLSARAAHFAQPAPGVSGSMMIVFCAAAIRQPSSSLAKM